MAIYIFTGRPRHGKTYALVKRGIKLLHKGERVYSNVKFNLEHFKKLPPYIEGFFSNDEDRNDESKRLLYWSSMHEWEHMEKGVIICDEAQKYFNSRRWESLSADTESKLQQHGKDGLDIYATVQHYRRIDVTVRELVEVWTDVETIVGNPNNKKPFLGLKVFRMTHVEGIEYFEPYINQKIMIEKNLDIPQVRRISFFRKKYGRAYDTLQKIDSGVEMPLKHKVRICNVCGKSITSHS